MDYVIFRDIAVVLIAGKYMGLLARRWKAPQVAGEILAGLLIGPCLLGLVQPSDFLTQMAELGVVLLMFSAGLDSDIDEIIKSGPIACWWLCVGYCCPLRQVQLCTSPSMDLTASAPTRFTMHCSWAAS